VGGREEKTPSIWDPEAVMVIPEVVCGEASVSENFSSKDDLSKT